MPVSRIFTPAESRLAALLFGLTILGLLSRAGRGYSPELEAWLRGPDSSRAEDTLYIGAPDPGLADSLAVGRGPVGNRPALPSDRPREDGIDSSGAIDPNRATETELQRLPGVGPVLAARILKDRAQNGAYAAPEDLLRVKGIGPTILERIRSSLKFE